MSPTTPPAEQSNSPGGEPTVAYTLAQLARYFLKLGATGFGGPIALVEYMRRDLVDHRRWVTRSDYDTGLSLAQLSPGPLAAQLAFYLGFVHYGVLGATVVGLAFVAPSLVMVLGLSVGYVAAGGAPLLQAVFYTTGAAIIGIIARSAQKLTTRMVGRDPLLIGIWATLAITTVATGRESIPLVVGAGVLAWLVRSPPHRGHPKHLAPHLRNLPHQLSRLRWPQLRLPTHRRRRKRHTDLHTLAPAALLPLSAPALSGGAGVLGHLALYFGQAGAFVFGSGLAIVPFLFGGVVLDHQWLTEQQFIDAVAVSLLTPGPIVITTAFIGYLVADLPGALVAAAATFLPAYLLTIIPAPYVRRHGQHPTAVAIAGGVTAAATGAITGAVIVLGQRSITDWPTLAIAAGAYLALWRIKKLPEPAIIAAAALLGLASALVGS